MLDRIVIPAADTWHTHLRENELMYFMIDHLIASGFQGRVLAEPNTKEPLLHGYQADAYKRKIEAILDLHRLTLLDHRRHKWFDVVVTIQITENTTPQMIYDAYALGVRVAKVYPRDVTTNSTNGVVDYLNIYPALRAAQECGMIVQFHGEHPSHDVEGPKKEVAFIMRIITLIVKEFPRLKISLEHISTSFTVQWIRSQNANAGDAPRIVGGLAPQYLCLTSDDVEGYTERSGYKGQTNLICKPKLKWNEDRAALQAAAVSGEPWFVFGPDDAPHYDSNKGPGKSNCGVFNTRDSLPALIEDVFEPRNALNKFPVFMDVGRLFYGFPLIEKKIAFERKPWRVREKYPVATTEEFVTPMFPGRTFAWSVIC